MKFGPQNFKGKLAFGFTITLFLAFLIACAAWFAIRSVSSVKDTLISQYADAVIETQKLDNLLISRLANSRGYQLRREPRFLEAVNKDDTQFLETLSDLKLREKIDSDKVLLEKVSEQYQLFSSVNLELNLRRNAGASLDDLTVFARSTMKPRREELVEILNLYIAAKKNEFMREREISDQATSHAIDLLMLIALLVIGMGIALAWTMTRTLNESFQQSQSATRLREEILGVVAHDLKNPIAAILMNQNLLEKICKKLGTSTESADLLHKVQRITMAIGFSALRMDRLVKDLLDLGKIEGGKFRIEKTEVNINSLISDVFTAMKPFADRKRIELSSEVAASCLLLDCDAEKMMQILCNLIDNAIKFTPEHGMIHFSAVEQGDHVRFEVSDSGPGIPEPQIAHVFERFWQAEETRHQGSGLGLSIVKGIADAHDGTVCVKSTSGLGTTFQVLIPAKKQSPSLSHISGLARANIKSKNQAKENF